MNNLKNIVFDLGGVLIDLDRERCVRECHRIGFMQIDQWLDPYHPRGLFRQLERGAITEREFYDGVRRSIGQAGCIGRQADERDGRAGRATDGREVTDEAIRAAYLSFLDGIPIYKLRLVRELRERGLHTYALSNIGSIMFSRIRDEFFAADGLRLPDYFERAYLSFEMGLLKPSPEIYRAMIADSGMAPSETLFIDDNLENVTAARELGFQVYLAGAREDFGFLFA